MRDPHTGDEVYEMKWTRDQLNYEYTYRVTENLGIMCGDKEPTKDQDKEARDDAWAAIQKLEEGE